MTVPEKNLKAGAVLTTGSAIRILIYGINYAPEPIGVGRYTADIGSYLAKGGFEVEVITATPHYPGWVIAEGYPNRYSHKSIDGVRVTRCPLFLKKHVRGIWRFISPLTFAISSAPIAIWRIMRTKPATVLCVEPTLLSAPAALLAAKIVGARTVLHVQDLELDAAFAVGHLKGRHLLRLSGRIERWILCAFDMIVTISDRMQEKLKAKGVEPRRLSVVRNWVDLEKFTRLTGRSPYRDELNISKSQFVALYAGNIGPKQALHVVLAAAEKLSSKSNITFVIAGDGPEKEGLLRRSGNSPNVIFLPVQPEERLCDLLDLADVHLLPQNHGAADLVLPSKLGGMLASRKQCIVMAEPGTELYNFLENVAVIVPPGDHLALSEAIAGLCNGTLRSIGAALELKLANLDARKNLSAFSKILVPTWQSERAHTSVGHG